MDDYAAAVTRYTDEMRRAWVAAGGPAITHLEKLSLQMLKRPEYPDVRVALSDSTMHEYLHGRRMPHRWEWNLTFISVLRIAAEQAGIDPAVVGETEVWKKRHEAVLALPRPRSSRTGTLATAVPAPQGTPEFGADEEVVPDYLDRFIRLESYAERIRTYEPEIVPGLLQTPEYARAIIAQYWPDATAADRERLVELRMARQHLLEQEQKPFFLWAIVEEAAFRSNRFAARVMRSQIEHLIDLAAGHRNLGIQVIPASRGDSLVPDAPTTIFRFPGGETGDVVCLERPGGANFLYDEKDSWHYNWLFEVLLTRAASPDDTSDLLWRIRGEI